MNEYKVLMTKLLNTGFLHPIYAKREIDWKEVFYLLYVFLLKLGSINPKFKILGGIYMNEKSSNELKFERSLNKTIVLASKLYYL